MSFFLIGLGAGFLLGSGVILFIFDSDGDCSVQDWCICDGRGMAHVAGPECPRSAERKEEP